MVPGHACFNPDFPAVLISQGYLCYLSLCAQLSQETIQCQCYIRPKWPMMVKLRQCRCQHAVTPCPPCPDRLPSLSHRIMKSETKLSWEASHLWIKKLFLEQAAGDDFDLKIKPPIPSDHPLMKANCQRFGSGRKITLCCIINESGWYHATSKE